MALANDSITVTPGAGATVATHLLGGKEHQAVVEVDEDGHVQGSNDVWTVWQAPLLPAAAARDVWDIFNATGSGVTLRLRSLFSIRQYTAAGTVAVPWEYACIRTSAVGTGGTAVSFTAPATAPPATGVLSAAPADSNNTALPTQVTARSIPTGGATAAAYWFSAYLSGFSTATEQTSRMNFELMSGINLVPELPFGQPWVMREGQGMKVRQITATVGVGTLFGWLAAFAVA